MLTEFHSKVSKQRIVVDSKNGQEIAWTVYDDGPLDKIPMIFLPPTLGSAMCFFKQLRFFSSYNFRAMSVTYPVVSSIDELLDAFSKLIMFFHLKNVHLFGAGIGGYLAQLYTYKTYQLNRVLSLILCNSFIEPPGIEPFENINSLTSLIPVFILQKLFTNFENERVSQAKNVQNIVQYMVLERMEMTDSEFLSHLKISQKKSSFFQANLLANIPISIIESSDYCGVSSRSLNRLCMFYPNAKISQIQSGGPYPFLSAEREVNLVILVTLKTFYEIPDEMWRCNRKFIETLDDI